MVMFRSYFDASGKEDLGLVVVAGYVASAKKWADYQKKWNAVLDKHRVPYFRMSEFAHSTGAGPMCDRNSFHAVDGYRIVSSDDLAVCISQFASDGLIGRLLNELPASDWPDCF